MTSSLVRHIWDGAIHILRNQPEPLFPTGREGLWEEVDSSFDEHANFIELDPAQTSNYRTSDQAAARNLLLDYCGNLKIAEFEWILLADADCITLRNLDHLFDKSTDLLTLTDKESGMPDPGFIAVHSRVFHDFICQWQEVQNSTTESLKAFSEGQLIHKIISNNNWRSRDFERGEVVRASSPETLVTDIAQAAVIHFGGLPPAQKKNLAFALHMMSVYNNDEGVFFDMLES